MKLKSKLMSMAAILALSLSKSAEAYAWDCAARGGSHDALRIIHGQFNLLFGEGLLTAAAQQCYFAICNAHVFGFCNRAGVQRQERPDERNRAKDTDPFSGSNCAISFGPPADTYNAYIFSHVDNVDICEGACGLITNTVRRC